MTTTSDEFYTPASEIELVRRALGYIELDPASCAEANKIVGAVRYYTKEQDGLKRKWWAKTVFCNPPYSRGLIDGFARQFVERGSCAMGGYENGILLVNANTSSSWFHHLLNNCYAVCFCGAGNSYSSRIRFVGGESTARASSAYFYIGEDRAKFVDAFGARGTVIRL